MGIPWRGWLLRALKVPPPPEPPDHGGRVGVLVFRASPRYLYVQLAKWALGQAGALLGLILLFGGGAFGLDIAMAPTFPTEGAGPAAHVAERAFQVIEVLGLIGFFLQVPVTFLLVVVEYEQRWYYLSARSIRIREGVRRIREMTFTYDNIQELSIQQGPLQRLLGIADLRVRTAGGGGAGGEEKSRRAGDASASFHVGFFRGVDDPARIRETIRERLRLQREREEEPPAAAREAETAAPADRRASVDPLGHAADSLAGEARRLRELLEGALPQNG
jgi:hypothetical protein